MRLFVSIKSPSQGIAKSPMDEAITFVAAKAALQNRPGDFPAGPALDITFMLAGEEEAPSFTGMRMGGYSEEGGTLYFEAAVPKALTRSEVAPRYVALVMQDMVDNAKAYFDELSIGFDSDGWMHIIDNLVALEPEKITAH